MSESRRYWRAKSDVRVREMYERIVCELEDELGVVNIDREATRERVEALEKELAAAQDKLATRGHRPGALAAAVDAESRLVAETARALDAGICPNPRHEDGPNGDRPSVFCRECYDLATRSLQELKERAQKAESQLQGARSEREQIKAELLRERDSHDRDGKALLKLRQDKKADEDALVAELEKERADSKDTQASLLGQINEWREACRKAKAERDALRSERDQLRAEIERVKHLRGVPLLPPTVPGIVDLDAAEARDATGRAP